MRQAFVMVAATLLLGAVAAHAQEAGWRADPETVRTLERQQPTFNYDEGRVPAFTLPDPLLTSAGARVASPEQWRERRREILELFREHVYGRSPGRPQELRFRVVQEDPSAMGGAATLSRVSIESRHRGREHAFELTLFVPNARSGPAPVFLLLNNRPATNTDPTRQERSEFWPAELMIERGYAIAAIQNAELAPDDADRFREGVMRLFEAADEPRAGDAWAALAAWGWGASRVMDYFETDPRIDASRAALVGHSRGGKAALWAGAEDERFALVISNESGAGGAALSRRRYGETVSRLNSSFPHWFALNFRNFDGREDALPVDQHMLMALIAPRALYVASADRDLWADPRGEFLSLVHSSPVYALWGEPAITPEQMPPLDQPLHAGLRGYHVRTGGHNLTAYDWARFADFADRLWR